jgi:chemotaxis protein MotB
MRKKKEYHEEHPDETWLIPYADVLTLLLALFIVMFAISSVDKEKFKSVSESFNAVLGGSSLLEDDGSSIVPMEESGSTGPTNSEIEEDKMNEIKSTIEEEIGRGGYADRVKIGLTGEGLEISIQDVVLFNSGDAEVLKDVSPLLLQISNAIVGLENEIKIVGHTDNVPITNQKFRSNWDLSSMRAVNVMNFMVGTGKILPEKVSIQAYGQFKPKASNDTEAGRAQNRRVEIFIVRQYPETAQ